ncbi:hypothetical protein V8E36_002456 [Tilletia maclaganii]
MDHNPDYLRPGQQHQQQQQQYQRHQQQSEPGFYHPTIQGGDVFRSADEASLQTADDVQSLSISPRPSTSQLVEDPPYSPVSPTRRGPADSGTEQIQNYYQLSDSNGRYEAVKDDLGGRPDSFASSSLSLAPSSRTKVYPISSTYRSVAVQPQNAQNPRSGLRNAYPLTATNGSAGPNMPTASGARLDTTAYGRPGIRPNLPVIKGGISEKKSFQQRQPWFVRSMILLVVCAIAAGAVVAVKVIRAHQNKKPAGFGELPTGGTAVTYFQLPAWDWTSKTTKAYGVNLGNWLLLERWLDEDAFVATCGATVYDEYHCMKGMAHDTAILTLQKHYDEYIVEADLDTMLKAGLNMVRIPLGFWALIPTVSPEPYVNAGQMDQLKKMLGWLNTRKMRAVISLHGMPGSQSGDQSTGQFRSKDHGANWFNAQNQQRSIATVQALMTWINNLSPELRSTITAILPVNEPNQMTNDDGTFQQTLQNFYAQSHDIISNSSYVTAIHSGFGRNNTPAVWADWLAQRDPNTILWEVHPYPGWFPSRSSKQSIYNRICNVAELSNQLGEVPYFVGEWSLLSGVQEDGWAQSYWQTQMAAYAQAAGSAFWTWKSVASSNPVVALSSENMALYDFQGLVSQGIIASPPTGQSLTPFLASLPNSACSFAASTAPANGTDTTGSGTGSGSGVEEGNGNPTPAGPTTT